MCASSYNHIQAFPHTLAMLVVTGSAVTEGGGCLGTYVVVCVYLGVVICTVGSLGLVEFVCGYLGEYLGLLVMSAVWRESTSDFGRFFPFVAIPR